MKDEKVNEECEMKCEILKTKLHGCYAIDEKHNKSSEWLNIVQRVRRRGNTTRREVRKMQQENVNQLRELSGC